MKVLHAILAVFLLFIIGCEKPAKVKEKNSSKAVVKQIEQVAAVKNSFKPFYQEYFKFIKTSSPDIYVNFEIGPSYSSRDEISIKGRDFWEKLPEKTK